MKFPVKLNQHIDSIEFADDKKSATLHLTDGKKLQAAFDWQSDEDPPKDVVFTIHLQRPVRLHFQKQVVNNEEAYVYGYFGEEITL